MIRRGKLYIVGNWKMNPDTYDEAKHIATVVCRSARSAQRTVTTVICPPAPFLALLARSRRPICLGTQDVSSAFDGAYTGEIAARHMRSVGATYAIVGHSERRRSGDTDTTVREKTLRSLEAGLKTIICVGEESRDDHGAFLSFVRNQLLEALSALPKKHCSDVIIAYEPVWAVGGNYQDALSPDHIHQMVIFIRKVLSELWGRADAMRVPILYGGSVDLENAKRILASGEVNGLLVGRRSLDATEFSSMIRYAATI